MADHAELKNLQRRSDDCKANLRILRDEKKTVEDKIQKEQAILNKLTKDIEKLKTTAVSNGKMVVSEHAIVRYFERVLKFDLEDIKRKILPDSLKAPIKVVGSGVFPAETHKVKVQNNVVVTIITGEES